MKTIQRSLAAVSAAFLLAGCASTSNQGTGAMGNDVENGVYQDQSAQPANPDSAASLPSAPNGSVTRANPFGLDSGTGMTRAQ